MADRARVDRLRAGGVRPWVLGSAVAAAAVMVVFLVPWNSIRPTEHERIKGGTLTPALAVYRRTAQGSETLADGAVTRAGDLLRLGYVSAGRGYGVILSIDGRGIVTPHLPPNGTRAAPLPSDGTILLDQAYELDDAPAWECFYFVTAERLFEVAPILDSARRAAARDLRSPRARCRFPASSVNPHSRYRKRSDRDEHIHRGARVSGPRDALPRRVDAADCIRRRFCATAHARDWRRRRRRGAPAAAVCRRRCRAVRPRARRARRRQSRERDHPQATEAARSDRSARSPDGTRGRRASHRRIGHQPHGSASLLLGSRRRAGTAPRRRSLLVSHAARSLGSDTGRRADSRPRRMCIRCVHTDQERARTSRISRGRSLEHARPCIPDVQRGVGDSAGGPIGSAPRTSPITWSPGSLGAADLSGDGKVTLNEAYQFAFNETLRRTVDTKAGPQHPSYDINLSGTGDVVMTDVRQTSAILVLSEDLDGRFFVRNAQKELVVELYKPRGRRVELGVEPGRYEVRVEIQRASLLAKTEVADGARVVLEPRQFGPVAVEATRRRGDVEPLRLAVNGRNRISLRWGMWRTSGSEATVSSGVDALDVFAGLEYTRYVREDLSIGLGVQGLGGVAGASVGPQGVFSGVADVVALPVVVRWNALKTWREPQPIKPFVAAGIGPVFGSSAGSFVGGGTVLSGTNAQATMGGHFGAGVDFHVARSFAIGVNGGYNWMVDFSQPVGARDNYSGLEFGLSIGWLFGRGRAD